MDLSKVFQNTDNMLQKAILKIKQERRDFGLDKIVGGLENISINTEPANLENAVQEILNTTNYDINVVLDNLGGLAYVLSLDGSCDIIVTGKDTPSPFTQYNTGPKSSHLPHTRLEVFTFLVKNIERFVEIQRQRGFEFASDDIFHANNYSYIQTLPSSYTGNALGFVEWKKRGDWSCEHSTFVNSPVTKPHRTYLKNIGFLDHAATRVRAQDRDAAIIEFMNLTNYDFQFAIYVNSMNSITNVARSGRDDYAQVFTSGITPLQSMEKPGPTEKFIDNYNTRVHHLAFVTENIEETYESLKKDGQQYLIGLVGGEEEGLKQTFTRPSKYTLLVNKYIKRYGGFEGFFTKSNVTALTGATHDQ